MFCGPRESFRQSTKKSVVMGNFEQRNTRSVGLISDEGGKRVMEDSELSEKLEVKVGMQQESVMSVVVDVVNESARLGAVSELLLADDLVLMS